MAFPSHCYGFVKDGELNRPPGRWTSNGRPQAAAIIGKTKPPTSNAMTKILTASMRHASEKPRGHPLTVRVSLVIEPVARAIKCFDGIKCRVYRAEFAPDAFDMAVDRPIIDIDVIAIGDVHQLVA